MSKAEERTAGRGGENRAVARHYEQRTATGAVVGTVLVAAITAGLTTASGSVGRATPALALVLPVVVAALMGGRISALIVALVAAASFNLAFITPRWTPKIASLEDGVAFAVFVVIALVVGTLVAWEADRRRAAEARTEEIQTLYRRYEALVSERERLMVESNRLALLSRIDEQRKALLRSVSHDLRTPLAAIRAATSDIRSGANYDEATREELLEIVADEADRLDRLVANLLSLSRIEAGALQPDRQAVAVDELVDERVRRLSRLFAGIHLVRRLPNDLPYVDADYSQLDQVITNLLENAARHSPAGGTIEIGAQTAGQMVEVWVADEGPGIDPAEVDQLFEPFRSGPGSASSGIGLAICRAIVEAHGGEMGEENGAHGGARFRFTLPIRSG